MSGNARASDVRIGGVFPGLCGHNLRFGLVDACLRAIDLRVLEVALPAIVLERSFCRFDPRCRLGQLRFEIVVIELHQEVAFVDLLIVVHFYFPNQARNRCAQRCEIAANVGVVSNLFDVAPFPRIPVASDGHDHSDCQKKNDQRRPKLLPRRFGA